MSTNFASDQKTADSPSEGANPEYSAQRNIERTKAYYTTPRHERGPMLTDDFTFVESPSMPTPGIFKGLEGMMIITPTLLGMFDHTHFEIKECTGAGDYTVALLELEAKALDNSTIHMQVAEVFLWEKGKLKMIQPYWFDIGALNQAIAAKRSRAVLEQK